MGCHFPCSVWDGTKRIFFCIIGKFQWDGMGSLMAHIFLEQNGTELAYVGRNGAGQTYVRRSGEGQTYAV